MKANHLHVIGLLLLFSLGHFWATFRVFAPTAPPRRHFHRAPIRLKAYRPAESSLVGGEGVGPVGRPGYPIDRAPQNKFCRDAFPVWMPPPHLELHAACPVPPCRENARFSDPHPPRRPQGMFLDPARTLVPFLYSSISIGIAIRGMGGDVPRISRIPDDERTLIEENLFRVRMPEQPRRPP